MFKDTLPGYYGEGTEFTFYNVSKPVGRWLNSDEGDVGMVQYFMSEIYRLHPAYQACGSPALVHGDLEIDGVCGKQTVAWITDFQRDSILAGCPLYVDGRVDRAVHGTTASFQKTRYAIIWMNEKMKEIKPWLFDDMAATDPGCPAFLSASMAQAGS
jgi:hypothetical protein